MGNRSGFHCPPDVNIRVLSRTNSGVDVYHPVTSLDVAIGLALQLRVPTNQMVCIEVDNVRRTRWDRHPVIGSNRWQRMDLDENERSGKIKSVLDHLGS